MENHMENQNPRRISIPQEFRTGIKIPLYRTPEAPYLDIPRGAAYATLAHQSKNEIQISYFNISNEDLPIEQQTLRGKSDHLIFLIENVLN